MNDKYLRTRVTWLRAERDRLRARLDEATSIIESLVDFGLTASGRRAIDLVLISKARVWLYPEDDTTEEATK